MPNPAPALPKNTPKRTGMGCASVGLPLLLLGVGGLAGGVLFDLDSQGLIAFSAVGLAVGSLGAVVGLGMVRQGRRIDALMSGQGLLTHWTYTTDQQADGSVFVGQDGVYHNGVYTEWSRQCVLQGVEITQDGPPTLVFRILMVRRNSSISSSAATAKKLRVPIAPGRETDAQAVVDHFQQDR